MVSAAASHSISQEPLLMGSPHMGTPSRSAMPPAQSLPSPKQQVRFVLVGLSMGQSVSEKLILLMLLISLSSACHPSSFAMGWLSWHRVLCSRGSRGHPTAPWGALGVPLPGCQGHGWLQSQRFGYYPPTSVLGDPCTWTPQCEPQPMSCSLSLPCDLLCPLPVLQPLHTQRLLPWHSPGSSPAPASPSCCAHPEGSILCRAVGHHHCLYQAPAWALREL